jgi:hypothetical protein
MALTKKQKYAKKLNKIAGRYGSMEDRTVRKILSLFKALRKDIADAIIHTENWENFRLRALQRQVNQLIDRFERQLKSEVDEAFEYAVADGRDSVLEPLMELSETLPKELADLIGTRPVAIPSVNTLVSTFMGPTASQANVAIDFSAMLIKNIVEPMRAQIDSVLRQAILGRLKPLEAMRRVTNILGVEARAGVWAKRKPVVSGVAARAETDVRTEMQRMYNLSNQSQMNMLSNVMPDLLKRWVATSDSRTRTSHLEIHNQTRVKPIPVDKPFWLTPRKGPRRGKRFPLMYPGDPTAPPELTINCRCKMAIIHPEIGVIGSSLDGRIAAELKRRGISIKEAVPVGAGVLGGLEYED